MRYKVDELERSIHRATPLYEVCSHDFDDGGPPRETTDMVGVVRFMKTRARNTMPQNTEELRHRLAVEGIMWLFLAARYYSRPLFRDLTPNTFLDHVEYLLGDKVLKIAINTPGASSTAAMRINPVLTHVLNYDWAIRKKAFEIWKEDKSQSLATCLLKARQCGETRQLEFTEKLSLPPKAKWGPTLEAEATIERPAAASTPTRVAGCGDPRAAGDGQAR